MPLLGGYVRDEGSRAIGGEGVIIQSEDRRVETSPRVLDDFLFSWVEKEPILV